VKYASPVPVPVPVAVNVRPIVLESAPMRVKSVSAPPIPSLISLIIYTLPGVKVPAVHSSFPSEVAVNVVPTLLFAEPTFVKSVVPTVTILYSVPTTKEPAVNGAGAPADSQFARTVDATFVAVPFPEPEPVAVNTEPTI
jgi:hypothetical protein